MAPLFAAYPQALTNTLRVAERCAFDLRGGIQDLPHFPTPHGLDAPAYLRHLCEAALLARYASVPQAVYDRLLYELEVIGRARLANYFLIVWDIVRHAREQGIRCQGRGSAANSLVAYLLDITPIDPLAHDLVFERFLSDERQLAPDIDVDFQADRREEVIQYVYERYGAEHVAMACTFVTFRARSAVRDVGKALGIPPGLLARAAQALDSRRAEEIPGAPGVREQLGPEFDTPLYAQLVELCRQIEGFPRHLGIHNGGMVITAPPLAERVPSEPATMPGRVVVQWDKESLEEVGLVKIDLLGLRMLSAIAETLDLVEAQTGCRPALDHLAFDDPTVYALIARADTVGVFQVEVAGAGADAAALQAGLLRRPDRRHLADPARPDPGQHGASLPAPPAGRGAGDLSPPAAGAGAQGDAGRDPVPGAGAQGGARRGGLHARPGRDPAPGAGQQARPGAARRAARGLRAGRRREGRRRAGRPGHLQLLAAFGGYSFPKSHAAAFAVIVYQSAWLKRMHPAAFLAALLNNQPMGFWSPAVLVNDARRHGIARAAGRREPQRGALRAGGRARHPAGPGHREGLRRGQRRAAARRAAARPVRGSHRPVPPHLPAAPAGREPGRRRGVRRVGD